MRLALIVLAAYAATACDVGFVEAQPPRLSKLRVSYSVAASPEPVVYGLLIDLDIPDAGACAAAMSWAEGFVDSAMRSADAAAIALPEQRLSGDLCSPQVNRSVNVDVVLSAVSAVQAARPFAHVRPVLIYVNNLALPLAAGIAAGLGALGQLTASWGAVHPLLWAIAPPLAQATLFVKAIPWTFSQDAQIASSFATLTGQQLPLLSTPGGASGPLQLPAGQLAGVQVLKLCADSEFLTSTTLPAGGAAYAVAGASPSFSFTLPGVVALPRPEFSLPAGFAVVEACSAFCDHDFNGDDQGPGTPWSRARYCAPSAAAAAAGLR